MKSIRPLGARPVEPASLQTMRTLLDLAIERIYAAGMGDLPWSDALAAIARSQGADSAILYTPEGMEAGAGLWALHDVRREARALRAVTTGPRAEERTETAFSTLLAGGAEHAIPATLFALFRVEPTSRFAPLQADVLELLCRHLSLAIRLWFGKRSSKHGAEALASALSAAALIVDRNACVIWMNSRAHAWTLDGRLVVARSQLAGVRGFPNDITRAIRDAVEGRGTILSAGETTLEIAPVPMPPGNQAAAGDTSAALLLMRDRNGCQRAAAALAAKFQLTPSETDLAMALWKGMLLAEYASQRSVAMSTVRTQLKSLLAKTASRRQSDIVSMVSRMQPLLCAPSPEPRTAADSCRK